MTQLNMTPLDNDDTATADLFNEKFAAIARILNKGIEEDNIKDGALTAALMANDMMNKQYPIGTIYWNGAVSTNPAELLGFGVWSAYAVGRGVVGFDASQTEFNAVGKTGGAKTVSLTAAQNGQHSHGVSDPGHAHTVQSNIMLTGSSTLGLTNGPYERVTFGNQGTTSSGTGISIQNSGSGEAHDNMPPFTVAYGWIRTA